MKSFKNIVSPLSSNFMKVKVSDNKVRKIVEFVNAVICEKRTENHHKIDGSQEFKRFYTGTLGEAAIEEMFQKEFIDWSIGESSVYHIADLRKLGLNIGIKTVELGKFPIVHKKVLRPEIVNIKIDNKTVWVCGYASIQVLKKYQDDNLILSPLLRKRGTKSGFWGFAELRQFKTFSELKQLNYDMISL
jgi:hypothetical protein